MGGGNDEREQTLNQMLGMGNAMAKCWESYDFMVILDDFMGHDYFCMGFHGIQWLLGLLGLLGLLRPWPELISYR
jgi:hypothetical protein